MQCTNINPYIYIEIIIKMCPCFNWWFMNCFNWWFLNCHWVYECKLYSQCWCSCRGGSTGSTPSSTGGKCQVLWLFCHLCNCEYLYLLMLTDDSWTAIEYMNVNCIHSAFAAAEEAPPRQPVANSRYFEYYYASSNAYILIKWYWTETND